MTLKNDIKKAFFKGMHERAIERYEEIEAMPDGILKRYMLKISHKGIYGSIGEKS